MSTRLLPLLPPPPLANSKRRKLRGLNKWSVQRLCVFIHDLTRNALQRLEWEAIIAKHPPCKALAPKDLPRPGQPTPPPHRLYGWPFTEEYLLDYARRHRLEFPVCSAVRARFEGKEEYNFGDLTDDHLADGVLVQHLQRVATTRVRRHFIQAGASVDIGRPLSLKWDSMFVLWSTRDFEPKYRMYKMFKNWDKVKKFVDDALNECLPEGCERRTSLEWWWSLENAFVSAVLALLLHVC